jgi:hypothetical protein
MTQQLATSPERLASESCLGIVCVGVLLWSRASASCFGIVRRRLASERFDSTQTCGDVTRGLGTDGKTRDLQAPRIVLRKNDGGQQPQGHLCALI